MDFIKWDLSRRYVSRRGCKWRRERPCLQSCSRDVTPPGTFWWWKQTHLPETTPPCFIAPSSLYRISDSPPFPPPDSNMGSLPIYHNLQPTSFGLLDFGLFTLRDFFNKNCIHHRLIHVTSIGVFLSTVDWMEFFPVPEPVFSRMLR